MINDHASFFTYKWNLAEFLSRKNGFPVFAGDRDEILAKYRKDKNAGAAKQMSRIELINNVTDFIGKEMT